MYQIMHKAEANDLIRKNPVRFAEKMKAHKPVKRKEAFTQEEVKILMEQLPDNKVGHTIRLMLATGMRTQEVLALEPWHIEPDGSCIHIRQAVNMVRGKPYIGPPKTANSVRGERRLSLSKERGRAGPATGEKGAANPRFPVRSGIFSITGFGGLSMFRG